MKDPNDAYGPGGLRVAAKRCDQCLFSPNKIVSDKRKAEILRKCRREDGFFICHKSSLRGEACVCAGYAEGEARSEQRSQMLRIAQRLNMIVLVDPVTGEAVTR